MAFARAAKILSLAALVCLAYFVGRGSLPSAARQTDSGAQRVLYYVDPMHPGYRSDKPGKAPDCGMDLKAVYSSDAAPASIAAFETEKVQTAPFTREVRTSGRVAPDEALTFTVSAGVDGWVRRVYSDRTGTRVKRGDKLASFYSRDISSPQQAYIYSLDSYERLRRAPSPVAEQLSLTADQLSTARDNLQFIGMGKAQLDELARTRRELYEVDLVAPADGLILERHVAAGQRFMKGESLYRIAGLDHVWVLAEIYPGDAALASSIRTAQVSVEGLQPIDAHISPVPAQFNEQGRTGRLRLEVGNAGGILVPGMVVNVVLRFAPRPTITVHADAVIDSGADQHVFVAGDGGAYEPREVETGAQQGDRVEILSGLKAGERVVTAGAFLLDSESRMKNPAVQ